jgi:phosphocarrier protein FPr/phosphocarrier protein
MTMSLKILAPCDGWCAALDEVPDPVFAGRMLGDGVAIDPTRGVLVAPCGGEIITLPESSHAVSIRSDRGIDVLIHIGIDTVQLAGRGFEARVRPGALVCAGDELIRFDLDVVARGAKSLLTPIVVTSMEGMSLFRRHAPGVVNAGETLFEIVGGTMAPTAATAALTAVESTPTAARQTLVVTLRQGLHARPAALLAQRAKSFAAETSLLANGRSANARSVVAIMALGVRHGDELSIHANGTNAVRSVASLIEGIQEALRMESAASHGMSEAARVVEPQIVAPQVVVPQVAPLVGVINGAVAAPGYAVGRVVHMARREIAVAENGAGVVRESAALAEALANVRLRLTRVADTGGVTRREIISAHLAFLDDPQILETAHECIAAGRSAGFAWRAAIRRFIAVLEGLEDSRLRERADDLLDVESHVLLALSGEARPINLPLPERTVLVADDLLPSELTAIDAKRLAGICLANGGRTSHVAILAAAMDVPMLVGMGPAVRDVTDGSTVIVDADAGQLRWSLTPEDIDSAQALVESRAAGRMMAQADAQHECRSRDGERIEIFANLGNVNDAKLAVMNGAEGCGLLRTEFLFIDRETAPDETEQRVAYQGIADALGARPLILRLMDVGGDKPLHYLPLPVEDNPALGLRGVRTALARPDLLRTQLRAALGVRPVSRVRLLIPMVTDLDEILTVRAAIDELLADLDLHEYVELGAMIETPAAALIAPHLLREVDFLSIGSNDLTQYTLAMDRGHPQLAARTDALHPAVLKLIAAVGSAGAAAGKVVAVCGGVAADRFAIPILLGLGMRELSVVPAAVPAIKRQVGALRINECRDLARQCLELASAGEVRALVAKTLAPPGDR